jgi:hypothetical protein
MRIYFDVCCLKRPFDDQSIERIALEAKAVLALIEACRIGLHEIVSSSVLRYENEKDPEPSRVAFVSLVLESSPIDVDRSESIDRRASEWNNVGVPEFDAFHLALAEMHADVFCTVDELLLKKYARMKTKLRIVDLLTLFQELLPWESH